MNETINGAMIAGSINNFTIVRVRVRAVSGQPPLLASGGAPDQMVSLVGHDRENPGETVLVCSIDGLGLPRLDFLKIDVEGMEADVPAEARTMRARSP